MKKGKDFNLKNTIPTVANRTGSIRLSGEGIGALNEIDGIPRKENYVEILNQHLKTSARALKLGRNWVFQEDNDPKCTSKVTKCLKDDK